jgi:hypothetical protein
MASLKNKTACDGDDPPSELAPLYAKDIDGEEGGSKLESPEPHSIREAPVGADVNRPSGSHAAPEDGAVLQTVPTSGVATPPVLTSEDSTWKFPIPSFKTRGVEELRSSKSVSNGMLYSEKVKSGSRPILKGRRPDTNSSGGSPQRRPPPTMDVSPIFYIVRAAANAVRLSDFSISRILIMDLELILGPVDETNVSTLKDGSILVRVASAEQGRALCALSKSAGVLLKVAPHPTLNKSRGTIYAGDSISAPIPDVLRGFQERGWNVSRVSRLRIRDTEPSTQSPVLLLTFDSPTPPPFVRFAWTKYKVKPYVPPPQQCYGCFRFGHMRSSCKMRAPPCANCGGAAHYPCPHPSCCVNCGGSHRATSRSCPHFEMEELIQTFHASLHMDYRSAREKAATELNISLPDARGSAGPSVLRPGPREKSGRPGGSGTRKVEMKPDSSMKAKMTTKQTSPKKTKKQTSPKKTKESVERQPASPTKAKTKKKPTSPMKTKESVEKTPAGSTKAKESVEMNSAGQAKESVPLSPQMERPAPEKRRWQDRPSSERLAMESQEKNMGWRTSRASLSQSHRKYTKVSRNEDPSPDLVSRCLRSDTAAGKASAQEMVSVFADDKIRFDYEGTSWWPPELTSSFLPFGGPPSAELLEKIKALSGVPPTVAPIAPTLGGTPLVEDGSLDSVFPPSTLPGSFASERGSPSGRLIDTQLEGLAEDALPQPLSPCLVPVTYAPAPDASLAPDPGVMDTSTAEIS